jgi:hypothetical protein
MFKLRLKFPHVSAILAKIENGCGTKIQNNKLRTKVINPSAILFTAV